MPTIQQVIPLLVYEDIEGAHDFLVRAFGFSAGGIHRDEAGVPVHAEVRAGDTTIWLHRVVAEQRLDSARRVVSSSGLVVRIDDVDAHHRMARGAGARIESDPTDMPYGQREYAALDPEGHRWWFFSPLAANPGAV